MMKNFFKDYVDVMWTSQWAFVKKHPVGTAVLSLVVGLTVAGIQYATYVTQEKERLFYRQIMSAELYKDLSKEEEA